MYKIFEVGVVIEPGLQILLKKLIDYQLKTKIYLKNIKTI